MGCVKMQDRKMNERKMEDQNFPDFRRWKMQDRTEKCGTKTPETEGGKCSTENGIPIFPECQKVENAGLEKCRTKTAESDDGKRMTEKWKNARPKLLESEGAKCRTGKCKMRDKILDLMFVLTKPIQLDFFTITTCIVTRWNVVSLPRNVPKCVCRPTSTVHIQDEMLPMPSNTLGIRGAREARERDNRRNEQRRRKRKRKQIVGISNGRKGGNGIVMEASRRNESPPLQNPVWHTKRLE